MTRRSRRTAPAAAVTEDENGPPPPKPLVTGVASALSPMVRRILAPNPGVMTGPGTNTYLVGIDEVVVLDPGPDEDGHLDAILGCGGDRIRWVVCTHTHPDHHPLTARLAKATGAEVLAYDSRDGLAVDRELRDGDLIEATEFRLRAVHTPGHASNHLCFLVEEERLLFSGDHVMQGSTVVIAPPDGDMAEYLVSLHRLRSLRPPLRAIAPGHGHLIEDPATALDELIAHRLERERQVLATLDGLGGRATPAELAAVIYPDLVEELVPRARQTVHAHLRKLGDEGRVGSDDPDDEGSAWAVSNHAE
jgi:glyoxylase-like metal-dependent hydrolase (beta-lactamase superfamily II)